MTSIHRATTNDLPAVRQLLQRNELPLDGVDNCVSSMVVARAGPEVVGCAAVELYPDGALLRSVAVDPAVRGTGVGSRLTQAALSLAAARGAQMAFLLTTTAAGFFRRLGFEGVLRKQVPESVRTSVEFVSACPASALAMRMDLRPIRIAGPDSRR